MNNPVYTPHDELDDSFENEVANRHNRPHDKDYHRNTHKQTERSELAELEKLGDRANENADAETGQDDVSHQRLGQ